MSGSAPTVALRVFRAIGRDDLADDPDFSDPQRRLQRSAEVDKIVADWVSQQTLKDAMQVFEDQEIAAAPVYTIDELIDDDQMKHREVFIRIEDKQLESMLVQAPVPRFSGGAGIVDQLGPELGAHTSAVLSELLGLTESDIADLRDRRVI
jgi:crotonobetainyl-CoA:carnitine CoA-transferase CaiB-like acyl-CoA transferase